MRPDAGSLIENFVLNEFLTSLSSLDKIFFWRTLARQEVDFIYQRGDRLIPIEVKNMVFRKESVPSGMKSFIQNYKPEQALVVTRGHLARKKI